MFQLKNYQARAVETMRMFLAECRQQPVADAYQTVLEQQKMEPHSYQC